MSSPRRLDQLLAALGYGSRRDAQALVKAGRVRLSGVPASRADLRVQPAEVTVDGQPLEAPDGLLVLLHKPLGLTCSHNPAEGDLIYDLLPPRWLQRSPALTSVGRLDKDTSGLLLLTDRGDWVHRWTSPRTHLPKIYEATLDRDMPADLPALFAAGTLQLRNEPHPCQPAQLEILAPRHARLTLTEGRYHQVRRMFASQGLHVETLHRTHFGHLSLGDLPPGQYRVLPSADAVTSPPL
ncbi:MAG: rRNA pseudouridine synthase [Verrucomicrobiales bacterium]|nr:rRNA pseudouridine synthase [Verrucomicrobiales bacterium]